MSNNNHNKKMPELPNKLLAYVCNCSTDMVRKVKANQRRDSFDIRDNDEVIRKFIHKLREQNLRREK